METANSLSHWKHNCKNEVSGLAVARHAS